MQPASSRAPFEASLAALIVVECSVLGNGPSGCGSILVVGLKMKSENKRIHTAKIIESHECKVGVILEEEDVPGITFHSIK